MVRQMLRLGDVLFKEEIDERMEMARLRIAKVFYGEMRKDPRNPGGKCSTGLIIYGCSDLELLAKYLSDKISRKHPMLTVDDLPMYYGSWLPSRAREQYREHLVERVRLELIARTLSEMLRGSEVWYMMGNGTADDVILKGGWSILPSVVDLAIKRRVHHDKYRYDRHYHGRPGDQERRRAKLGRRAAGESVSAAA